MEKAGAKADIVSPAGSSVHAWDLEDWGQTFRVDVPLKKARPEDYVALVLPGGVMNPDRLRLDRRALDFVKAFFDAGKPVAAIAMGPGRLSTPEWYMAES